MKSLRPRPVILLLIAFAVGTGSLLVPEPASAQHEALFRVERRFLGVPLPPVTTAGGAGSYQNYIEPYTSVLPYPIAKV